MSNNIASRVLIKGTREAERGIRRGFIWSATPQGHEYWAEVVKNLKDLRTASEDK